MKIEAFTSEKEQQQLLDHDCNIYVRDLVRPRTADGTFVSLGLPTD